MGSKKMGVIITCLFVCLFVWSGGGILGHLAYTWTNFWTYLSDLTAAFCNLRFLNCHYCAIHFQTYVLGIPHKFLILGMLCPLQYRLGVNVQIYSISQIFIFWYVILNRNWKLFSEMGIDKLWCNFIIDLNPLCCVGKELEGVAKSALFVLKWSSKLMGS